MQRNDGETLKELVKCGKAALVLQIQAQQPEAERAKPEVVLARAGFIAREIGQLLGKSEAAVAKTLQRSGKVA
jgi:hypothetical protein